MRESISLFFLFFLLLQDWEMKMKMDYQVFLVLCARFVHVRSSHPIPSTCCLQEHTFEQMLHYNTLYIAGIMDVMLLPPPVDDERHDDTNRA